MKMRTIMMMNKMRKRRRKMMMIMRRRKKKSWILLSHSELETNNLRLMMIPVTAINLVTVISHMPMTMKIMMMLKKIKRMKSATMKI